MENQNYQDTKPQGESSLAWTLVIILTLLLITAMGIILLLLDLRKKEFASNTQLGNEELSKITLPSPAVTSTPTPAIMKLNRELRFPFTDVKGEKVGEIIFFLEDVERTHEVMIAGQKATAVPGRELVIINLELTNNYNQAVSINARDYVRLKVNQEEKQLAPDYHSDPVDVRPQSSKKIRIGFNIAETDTNIVLQVGELEGPKDLIELD